MPYLIGRTILPHLDEVGVYSAKLRVTNADGGDEEIKTGLSRWWSARPQSLPRQIQLLSE